MPDPTTTFSIVEAVEKVGYSLVAVIGLVAVLKWLSRIHLKALNDRIVVLEGIVVKRDKQIADRDDKIESMHQERLAATVAYGHDMKVIAERLLENDRANRDVLREFLRRPCQLDSERQAVVPITDRTPSR